ncbi:MAG: PspC domain-containing protein [candidate division Zixibacteria bacterium]|nr:PspC domain-containing protein [candidate division Zixibacteria bacterium]
MTKKLYRSRTNKMIAGVCAGLGDFFELDPTLIRLGAVVLVLAAGVGILAYIVAWIIVPLEPWESVGK